MSHTGPESGFVLGKFMPPHQGHVFLCDFARAYCRRLTILVCSLPDDPVPGALRFAWMREMFPDCVVVWCQEDLPQVPEDHPEFWQIWRDVVKRYAGTPDVVFASEDYGLRLAEKVGARFVPVDQARLAVPVSATMIRADPFRYWSFIPPVVRSYYARRVCLFGPESTGKSTLAQALAVHFSTVMVPEYGRVHTQIYGAEVTAADLVLIARGHKASVVAAGRQANRLIIEDTDPVLTAVWSDMLLGGRSAELDAFRDYADLYLLCDIDVAWEDDGTRYFPGRSDRERFFTACRTELETRGLPYRLIQGEGPSRQQAAVDAIVEMFPGTTAD